MLRYRVEFWLVLALAWLFRRVPIDTGSAAMGTIWRWIGPLTARHRRLLDNLALAMPELDAAERRRIAIESWRNLGRVAAETFVIDRILADPSRILLPERARTILAAGTTGAVLVSLHAGNWEVVVEGANRIGRNATGVYKALRNPLLDAWLIERRKELYRSGILPKSADTARALLGSVKRGGTIAVMADLRDSRGIEVPFFGQPAFANPFPALTARMTGASLFAGIARRVSGARFVIEVAEIEVPRTADRAGDIARATAEMHRCFEDWIRADPAQWMWIQRKWVTRRDRGRMMRDRAAAAAAAEAPGDGEGPPLGDAAAAAGSDASEAVTPTQAPPARPASATEPTRS